MLSQRTQNYAAPPSGYFWAWSPEHDAVEWYDGSTLALWQELHGMLRFLGEEGGLPPLGALLLLLAACKDDWLAQCIVFHEKTMKILGLADVLETASIPEEIKDTIVRGLKVVNDLPKDLRSSFPAKCLLVSALFEGGPFSLSRDDSSLILQELSTHGPGIVSGVLPQMQARARFMRDMRALRVGLARHDASTLESRLRTGLEVSNIEPPVLPERGMDEDDTRHLLDRLIAGKGEGGAAAGIAKRAIAMLNFPGSLGSPSDLPIGGISDITNRGTIDRLLPGELAHDDLVLAARLVHNEALYFRREVPPSRVTVRHTILLDRNIRLWGTPRVFALGVALGLRHHPALAGPSVIFGCHAATVDGFEALDLASPQGVRSALVPLVPAVHPGGFLTAWWEAAMAEEDAAVPDLSFITVREHVEDAGTRVLLGRIAEWIHGRSGVFRVLALDRAGGIGVESWSPGGNRPLFHGEIALDDIIAPPAGKERPAPPPLRAKRNPLHQILPIYALDELPFLFPKLPQGSSILEANPPDHEILGITTGHELMAWPAVGWGGREILSSLPGRQHWLGKAGQWVIVIASGQVPGDPVRVFRLDNGLCEIPIAASKHSFPRLAKISGGAVILGHSDSVEAFSLESGKQVAAMAVEKWPVDPVLDFDGATIRIHDSGKEAVPPLEDWPFGDPTWPRMFHPTAISFTSGGLSVKCQDDIFTFDPQGLKWSVTKGGTMPLPVAFESTEFSIEGRPALQVARRAGVAEAWLDSRGILHMRDLSDPKSTPWSILLCTIACAAWNESWGLCALDRRLRQPSDVKELPPLALRDLERFLSPLPKKIPMP